MIGIFVSPRRKPRGPSQTGQPDLIPPAISNLLIDDVRHELSFTSSEAGACHWLLDATTTFADAAALVAAKPAGEASGNALATIGANTASFDATGIASGNWRLHVGIIDGAGNASNVLSGDFTIISGALELNGDPLVWNGDQLIFNAA